MSSKEARKRPVPKFSSFKPKEEEPSVKTSSLPPKSTPTPHGEVERGFEESRRARDGGRHRVSSAGTRSVGHSRDADRHHRLAVAASEPRFDPHAPLPARVSERSSSSTQQKDRDGENSGGLFVFDRRGDPLIRRYGTNDRRGVPEYRRFGSGRVLGADGFMRIDRAGNHDEFFIRGFHEGRSVLGGDRRSLLAQGARRKSHLVRVRVRKEEAQDAANDSDFIALRPSKRRKRDGDEPEALSDDEDPSYRSIHGKAKPHEHSDSDEEYDSDSSAGSGWKGADDPVTARSVELSRRTREHPEDIEAWLALVDHQDVLLNAGSSGGGGPSSAEIRSYADIKLSMLEKAMSHATTGSQRLALQLRIMHEGARVWDAKNLDKRWKDAMQKHGSDFEMWRAYVNYRQTTLATFQYDEIKKLYAERLRLIRTEATGLPASSDPAPFYEQLVYVFLRMTCFVADAGFRELGTALWQAVLELTFCRPAVTPENDDDLAPPSFEAFWESEVARLGEGMARGWAAFQEGAGAQEPPEPKTSARTPTPNTRDGFKAWAIIEHHRASMATLPARTLDDDAEDDPYRVVMYGDLQDLLPYFPIHVIPSIYKQLLDAFLAFAQLPPAFDCWKHVRGISRDAFVVRSPIDLFTGHDGTDEHGSNPNPSPSPSEATVRKPDFSHAYPSIRRTPEVLFPSQNWFRYLNRIREHMPPDQYRWLSTTLKQLVRSFGVKELGPYYLAFESLNEPGSEKKTAKALLKQDPTNVDLYEGYAILEWARSNKAAARNVVAAAISLPALSDDDRCRLRITWAWMELEDEALGTSTQRLCCEIPPPPGDEQATPSQILKTRNHLASNRDYLLSSGAPARAVVYARGLALLEYLTAKSNREPSSGGQGDIWSAMASISGCTAEFAARGLAQSPAHEELLQFAARLLYLHASKG